MFLLLFLLFVLSEAASDSSVEPHVVQAKPGDDVILPCQTAEASIRAVQWTRDDLETSEYVLFYRNGPDPTHQYPSYKGRVELVDSQLKTGDVSLILKNASSSDPGTYECRVAAGGSGRKKRATTKSIRVIRLEVTGSDSHKGDNMHGDQTSDSPEDRNQTPGHAGLAAGVLVPLAVGAVVGVGVVMFLRTLRRRKAVRTSETPDADEAAVDVLPSLVTDRLYT